MRAVSGETRQQISNISGLIEINLVSDASGRLHQLIKLLPRDEFFLVSPEIRTLIEKFLKQRRRDLSIAFETRIQQLNDRSRSDNNRRKDLQSPLLVEVRLSTRVGALLKTLGDKHIFKWTPHYRDTLEFIAATALSELNGTGEFESEIASIGEQFSSHAEDIFCRGYDFQINRGLSPDVAEIKSVSGVQSFLDLIISIFLDSRNQISSAKQANVLWGLTSVAITGVLRGYGFLQFEHGTGWSLLAKNTRVWVPPLGFCRGSEVLAFFEDFPSAFRASDLQLVLSATTLAVERIAHQFHGEEILLPRLSRMSVQGQTRLDLTLSARRGEITRDLLITCFWGGKITNYQPIRAAQALRATAIIAALDERVREWIEREDAQGIIDASEVSEEQQQVHHFAELIAAEIERHNLDEETNTDPTIITHNFARDFPLDDPDFRRQFMVERHSVKKLLEEFDGSVGIHLWCSVRRSGKTTAAQELADVSGQSVVVAQTMDRLPRQPIQNIFSRRLTEAFEEHRELKDDFFVSVVRECTLASTATDISNRRIVFIIDEYESLFGLIDAYVRNDVGLKVLVALPLLSQMVDFATSNLLIFMGQRPDAYLILSAQNQLSPLVNQHNFPLFNHTENARDTEFTQLLAYVLSDKLAFDASFATAVFTETSGHPYLTVNLMVDFCDWLIGNKFRITGEALSAQLLTNFTKDRLTPAALKKSPHYEFFHGQLADYLSERGRRDEPWLYAIANTLRYIATKPGGFACAFTTYENWAEPLSLVARMSPGRMLSTGSKANFLREQGGRVLPGIRIMARIAGSAPANIN